MTIHKLTPQPAFNAVAVRKDFPIFQTHPNLTFLDSAASAQKPQSVLDAMDNIQTQSYANIHRGLYQLSQEATQAYEDARAKVAQFIHAPTNSIIFTRNSTESINLITQTWSRQNLQKGDGILITSLEHHANIVPWQMLAEEKDLNLHVVPCAEDGAVTLQDVQQAWKDDIKLVAISHMSNALGVILPVAEITSFAHSKGSKVVVDGSQYIVHGAVDVTALDADFYAFTGHKLYGPTGIGVLYGKEELLASMPPYQGGGDMIETVSFSGTTYAEAPAKFEAGTPNIVGAVGLGAAIDYLSRFNMADIQAHEDALTSSAIEQLSAIDGVHIYGTATPRASVVSFTLQNAHTHDVAAILDQCNVAVRTGHHCAMPLMEQYGISGTIRASFAMYNTMDDVTALVEAVQKAKTMLGA